MKKILAVWIMIFILIPVSFALAEDSEIFDGIALGMTKSEIVRIASDRNLPINSVGVYETTVAEQPFAVVNLFFAGNLLDFSAAEISDTQAIANDITCDLRINSASQNKDKSPLSTEEGGELVLAQACVTITSDYLYETAEETFRNIEVWLSREYGATRYTKRRGESLPMVEGYGPLSSFIVAGAIKENSMYAITLMDYSHRIIPLRDGRYMVIDHHLAIKKVFSDTFFQHRIVYSLIPVDISDTSNLTAAPTPTAAPEPVVTAPLFDTLPPSEAPMPVVTVSPAEYGMLERLRIFFGYWARNQQQDMLDLCSPTWANGEEYPKNALFILLRNRIPLNYMEESISGTADDLNRTVTVVSLMDRNNGKEPVKYRLYIVMVRESDGLWYVDPQSLLSYDDIDTMEQSGTVIQTPIPIPETRPDTVLYYNPSGGEYYHLDQYCKRVAEEILPLRGEFTYSQINDEKYKKLKPCAICGAPYRDSPTESEPATKESPDPEYSIYGL